MEQQELISTFIEIEPLDSDQFHKVKETLTRIGLVSRKQGESKPTLWQSCHVLRKRGMFFICHFKELFILDGKKEKTNFTEEDIERRNLIAWLLQEWDLIKLKKQIEVSENTDVVVISYAEKPNWECKAKYSIGKKNGKVIYEKKISSY